MTDSDDSPKAVKPEHTTMWGDTGTGKTTLARQAHAEIEAVSVWVNHAYDGTPEMRAEKPEGARVETAADAKKAVGRYSSWSNVRLVFENADLDGNDTVWEAVMFARECPAPVQVIVDEIDEVMSSPAEASENACVWAYRKGRSHSVKIVGISQTPTGLEWSALKNSRWWVQVGEPSGMHTQFFNRHKWMPQPDALPDEDFKYAVYDKTGVVVYRSATDPAYA